MSKYSPRQLLSSLFSRMLLAEFDASRQRFILETVLFRTMQPSQPRQTTIPFEPLYTVLL
jgi:hypothetical protein